jgi:hypothetical protein
MARKYDPVLLSQFKSFKEAHAATGIDQRSYFRNRKKYPDLDWPTLKKGRHLKYTAEQLLQFSSPKQACFELGICRETFSKLKKNNPHLTWPKEYRTKFDPAELANYANVHDAMNKTGIRYNNYYKYRKKYPDLDWPKPKPLFDPEEISKYKNAKEAELATGISYYYYVKLKKLYENDFDWPKNPLDKESLAKANHKKTKKIKEINLSALPTKHSKRKTTKRSKRKKVFQYRHQETIEGWKNELGDAKLNPLSTLVFMACVNKFD